MKIVYTCRTHGIKLEVEDGNKYRLHIEVGQDNRCYLLTKRPIQDGKYGKCDIVKEEV